MQAESRGISFSRDGAAFATRADGAASAADAEHPNGHTGELPRNPSFDERHERANPRGGRERAADALGMK